MDLSGHPSVPCMIQRLCVPQSWQISSTHAIMFAPSDNPCCHIADELSQFHLLAGLAYDSTALIARESVLVVMDCITGGAGLGFHLGSARSLSYKFWAALTMQPAEVSTAIIR